MEQLQLSYIGAIVAAAGCIILTPSFDDGIDLTLSHQSLDHTALTDMTARVEVQLKATHDVSRISSSDISANLSRERFEYYSTSAPTLHKIIIIMDQPKDQKDWVDGQQASLSIYRASYWVNIAGLTSPAKESVKVKAPFTQLLNDISLCQMMERIGKGFAP